uniref:Uncharacterized protein n=1 Tax=Arundo donax TaxID=35708 RepID=A0A0A9N5B1_ARUDO
MCKPSVVILLWLAVGFLDMLCQENVGVEKLLDVRNIVVLSHIDTTSHPQHESEAAPE